MENFTTQSTDAGALRDGGRKSEPRANIHPTVKPVELMRYLVRLVTPPNGIVLDPFMGSGSTGKAAMLENLKFAGIDMTPEYLEIARSRIKHAKDTGQKVVKEVPQTKARKIENKPKAKSLFKK